MQSESSLPISELIKGDPEKPTREPALALFACIFNLYMVYELLQQVDILSRLVGTIDPNLPMGIDLSEMLLGIFSGIIIFSLVFSIILVVGAGLMYSVNRRLGAALVLAFSVVALLISFISLLGGIGLIMGSMLGLFAGILGVRSKREANAETVHEII